MKKAHTDPYCLTDAPGEKARVALFGPAMSGQRVWGGKHLERLLNRKQVNRVGNAALATDLQKTEADTEGRAFASSTDKVGNGRLGAADKFGDAGLRVASPLNQNQVSSPAGRGFFGLVSTGAANGLVNHIVVFQAAEPFIHEAGFSVLNTPVNQCGLCVVDVNRTGNHFMGFDGHAQAGNPVLVRGNAGSRVNGSTHLYMSVAEQANIEGFHLRHLPVRQFGPVVGVIQRPERLAQKNAVRFALKRYAVLRREPAFAGGPVSGVPQVAVAKDVSDLGLRPKVLHNHVRHLLTQLFVFVHARILI